MNTMDCADIKALLSGLIDDQVDPETRHLTERHISNCSSCRALMNEAESLDRLIALEGENSFQQLPAGFEESVLRLTGTSSVIIPYHRRLSTWLGWMAAAASLALAMTIWVNDRQKLIDLSAGNFVVENIPNPPIDIVVPQVVAPVQVHKANYTRPVYGNHMNPFDDDFFFVTDDENETSTMEAVRADSRKLDELSDRLTISEDDALTLYTASILLEMIAHADTTTFADIEMARRIIEYDDVLQRLAAARDHLDPADLPALFAAESIFTRIVLGPIDINDLRRIRKSVINLNLAVVFDELSDRGNSA